VVNQTSGYIWLRWGAQRHTLANDRVFSGRVQAPSAARYSHLDVPPFDTPPRFQLALRLTALGVQIGFAFSMAIVVADLAS